MTKIRPLLASEQPAAFSLIWETFLQFEAPDYSEEGVESFRSFLSDADTVRALEFFGAFEGEELRGVVATREEQRHICCFFVRAQYHRQGIGRKLWDYLRRNSGAAVITVNSSPYGVPFYHALGFSDTDTEQQKDGIRFTPMKYEA